MQALSIAGSRLQGPSALPLATSARLPYATCRLTRRAVRLAAQAGDGAAGVPSRRELLANTLKLLSAAGVASLTGEQVSSAHNKSPCWPLLLLPPLPPAAPVERTLCVWWLHACLPLHPPFSASDPARALGFLTSYRPLQLQPASRQIPPRPPPLLPTPLWPCRSWAARRWVLP